MKHRHLNHEELTLAGIDDILERGRLLDWEALLREVTSDPFGPVANRVMRVVDHHPMYGTSTIWSRFVARRRAEAGQRPDVSEP